MNWFLERKLKQIGQRGNPSPKFVRALEHRLRQQTGHPVWWLNWSRIALVSVSTLAIATSSTGVYAYASDNVLPDHPLYGLRQGIEKIEETVALTPQRKEAIRQKNIQRHAQEQRVLEQRREKRQKELEKKMERKEADKETRAERAKKQPRRVRAVSSN